MVVGGFANGEPSAAIIGCHASQYSLTKINGGAARREGEGVVVNNLMSLGILVTRDRGSIVSS